MLISKDILSKFGISEQRASQVRKHTYTECPYCRNDYKTTLRGAVCPTCGN